MGRRPNRRVQPTGWIGAILAVGSGKEAFLIYQCCIPSRRLTRKPLD